MLRALLASACAGLLACAAPLPTLPAAPPPADHRNGNGNEIQWETIATSPEGRPIRTRTCGDGPRRVLWIGGIHGDEREGARATAELADAFHAEPGATERVTLLIVEDLNPDGTARNTRGNARGVDLNRNFPAPSFRPARGHGLEPLSEPESRALAELVASWRPDLVLVAHSWRGREFVNWDGPAREIAERFAAATGFELRGSSELGSTPGSFGAWAGTTLALPVLTIEFLRGRAPEEAWVTTRAAILAATLGH